MLAAKPKDQAGRRLAIRKFELGQQVHSGKMDNLVELASQVTDCPVALVSIVHEDAQRFEATCGLQQTETGLDSSICSHAILQGDILEIEDCRRDPRTADNPLVATQTDPLIFYAGAQITTSDGVVLGTVCVLDRVPRRLSDAQRRALKMLADQAMRMLELHDAMRRAETLRQEADHRVKNSLASIAAVARMSASRANSAETKDALQQVQSRISASAHLHSELYRQDQPSLARMDAAAYLKQVTGYLQQLAPPAVQLKSDFAPLCLSSEDTAALGLVVNEMVTNAFKHGFGDTGEGTVVVSGRQERRMSYVLSCRDNGLGVTSSPQGKGLGNQLMQASAKRFGGQISWGARADGPGFEARLTLVVSETEEQEPCVDDMP